MPIPKAPEWNYQVVAFRRDEKKADYFENDEEYHETLGQAIDFIERQEFHGGKYSMQVWDKDDKVVADIHQPYDAERIDILDYEEVAGTLNMYGASEEVMRKAIDYWLEQQKVSENATN